MDQPNFRDYVLCDGGMREIDDRYIVERDWVGVCGKCVIFFAFSFFVLPFSFCLLFLNHFLLNMLNPKKEIRPSVFKNELGGQLRFRERDF